MQANIDIENSFNYRNTRSNFNSLLNGNLSSVVLLDKKGIL